MEKTKYFLHLENKPVDQPNKNKLPNKIQSSINRNQTPLNNRENKH
jgi:hypothetical protein